MNKKFFENSRGCLIQQGFDTSPLDKVTTFKLNFTVCKIGKIGLGGVFPPI